jgi:hypothetical protein
MSIHFEPREVDKPFVSRWLHMRLAASLVFLGTLNYVAYRDIFERRSGNLPRVAATAGVGAAVRTTR